MGGTIPITLKPVLRHRILDDSPAQVRAAHHTQSVACTTSAHLPRSDRRLSTTRAPYQSTLEHPHKQRERDEACGGRYAPAHTKIDVHWYVFSSASGPPIYSNFRIPVNGFVCRQTGSFAGERVKPVAVEHARPYQSTLKHPHKKREREREARPVAGDRRQRIQKKRCVMFLCRRTGSFAGERVRLPANGFAYR